MAKHLHIVGGRDEMPLLTITVDGQEMTDVISYKMEGSYGGGHPYTGLGNHGHVRIGLRL